ncbi:hypothetical protein MLD38_005834 [Melastoma candidum]|nr:hypothetical protein MLD38_005834 [Melastoma candidum]
MIHEFASGLEESRVPFIWVVKDRPLMEGNCGSRLLPPGYEARVEGRGFVWYGWAPQLDILAHSSVGGFLTHCGWSSTVEALGQGLALVLFSGANSDQGLMARLLHEKGVGIEIPRDEMDGSFTREAAAETIRRVMMDEEGERIRANAWSMREVFSSMDLQKRYMAELIHALEYKKYGSISARA